MKGLRAFALLLVLAAGVAHAQPVIERVVDSGGSRLYVRVSGGGPEVVVGIPGGPGLSHDYLRPLERLAGPGRRVVLYDPRGVGHSSSAGPYDLAAQVADVEAIREALGVDEITVVGHSWGTVVAVMYADAHPDSVASVVLIGMGAPTEGADRATFGKKFGPRKQALIKAGVVAAKPARATGDDCMPIFDAVLPVHFADPRHPDAWTLPGTYRCSTGRVMRRAAGTWDLRPALARLAVPLLLLSGDSDLNDLGLSDTARVVPAAQVTRLPKCGHFPWLECPAAFYPHLEAFLRPRR